MSLPYHGVHWLAYGVYTKNLTTVNTQIEVPFSYFIVGSFKN